MVADSEGGEFAAVFENGEVEADGVGKDDRVRVVSITVDESKVG